MKRNLAIFLAIVACMIVGGKVDALANSAQTYWHGTTGTGAIVNEGQCPVVVEREELIFNVSEFPSNYYFEQSEAEQYGASVTASYHLYNPSELDVSVSLAFPFGEAPSYAYYYDEQAGMETIIGKGRYGVSLNGERIEATLRHTYSSFEFVSDTEVKKLRDGFNDEGFFLPELVVTLYKFEVSGIEEDRGRAYFSVDLYGNPTERRFILSPWNGYDSLDGGCRLGAWVKNGDTIGLYVLGKALDESPSFVLYKDANRKKSVSGNVSHYATVTSSFEEFALDGYDESSKISKVDYFNAVVDFFEAQAKGDLTLTNKYRLNLMQWYEYEIELGAGERAINTVTAPLFPSINGNYSPPIYEYIYLLSPAKGWADFGQLDIKINTPYHLTEDSLSGFEKTEDGYALTLDGLPEGELNFTLCQSPQPQKIKNNYVYGGFDYDSIFTAIAWSVGLFVAYVLVGFIVLAILKRRGKTS